MTDRNGRAPSKITCTTQTMRSATTGILATETFYHDVGELACSEGGGYCGVACTTFQGRYVVRSGTEATGDLRIIPLHESWPLLGSQSSGRPVLYFRRSCRGLNNCSRGR